MKLQIYLPFVITLGLAHVGVAAQIGTPAIVPGSAPVGVAATVTITAPIFDPSVIPSTVNLQQLDSQGRFLKVIGSMTDNGGGGDVQAGDKIYTIQVPVLSQTPGTQTYRVSAGFLGRVLRVFSSPLTFTVTGTTATGIAITQPANLTFTNISATTITGTVGDPGAVVQVNGITATRSGNNFQVSVPLQEGTNPITAVATNSNGTASTTSIQLTLDTTPPRVTVDSPAEGFTTTESNIAVAGLVNDLVVGTVNDQQATVTVGGVPAHVSNRRFVLENMALTMGANTIQVVGRDRTGNSATTSVTVTRQAPGLQSVKLISGNNQTGPVGTPLAAPLVVQVTNGGTSAANVPVIFKVTQNDGVLMPGNGTQQLISVNTDGQGMARATLTAGHRSGAGNNTVQAYAAGFQGVAVFTATGTALAPAKINVDTGNGQFGPIGQALALPLVTVVSDASDNRLSGVAVTFTVKQGGGSIGGQTTVQTTTDADGRALAVLTLGLQGGQDNNLVEANLAGSTGVPATFRASAKVPGDPAKTSISGVVVDNSLNPIAGVTMRLFRANQGLNNNQPMQIGTPVATDAKGFFTIPSAPVGLFKLMADGQTATQSGKAYPTLEYEIVTIAGQDNGVGMPIYLPTIDPAATVCVDATKGGELKPPNSPGFSLKLLPGAATFPGGSKTGCVSVSPVNPDKVPMAPAFGQQPRFVVTIQPVGTIFNPPAAVTVPNMQGLAPNSKTEMFSYDHDLSTFVSIGSATVSADGAVIASDPGVGVLKAGWFDGGPPPNSTFSVDPVDVKVASGATCAVDSSSGALADVAKRGTPAAAGDSCELADVTEGPTTMKAHDVRPFHAVGTVPGTYTWMSSDPSILRVEQQADPTLARVTALKPGKAEVVVRLVATARDAQGHQATAEEHIDVQVYAVESIKFTKAGAQTILKAPLLIDPTATEIHVPLNVTLKLTAPGAGTGQTIVQPVRLSFEDPDDDRTDSPVIDPNGSAGNDNAPVAVGGKRGAPMWLGDINGGVSVSDDGQTAMATAHCNLNGECSVDLTFLSSVIAGDNYIFKAEEVDEDGALNLLIRSSVRSGTWTVRRFVEFTGFEGTVIAPFVSSAMATSEIAPAFADTAYTDYSLNGVTNLPATPGGTLFAISPPNAGELPTDAERAAFAGPDGDAKDKAGSSMRNKAALWVLRNMGLRVDAEIKFAKRFGGGDQPAVYSIPAFDDKEDGVAGSAANAFYPAGLTISVLTGIGGSVISRQFDPNGDWPCLQVDVQPSAHAVFMQPFCPGVTPDHLRNLLKQAVAFVTDHEPFDPTDTGLLAPDAPSGVLDDKNVVRMRGYKKTP